MFILWVVLMVLAFIIVIAVMSNNQKQDLANGFIYSNQSVKYCGGFADISADKNTITYIRLNRKELSIQFISKNITKNIPIKKITDAMCKTTEEVNKMASLGKLIIFGYLALGMSSSKDIKKCAVITYEDDLGKERSLVFEMNPDLLVKNILDIKRNEI
jgi:hypothetical protein